MHLAKLEIENYRIFGDKAAGKDLSLDLQPGLNLILGENDSGKTGVIDAIRLVLGTTTPEYFPLTPSDFHCHQNVRAKWLRITAHLRNLSSDEAAAFLEHVVIVQSGDATEYVLQITLRAELDESLVKGSRRSPVRYEWRTGSDQEGQRFDGAARELLRATYLRPLRDAVSELTAKKGSRLAQILHSYPELQGHEVDDWDPNVANCEPQKLAGIMRRAEHAIRGNAVVKQTETRLNEEYLKAFSIGRAPLMGRIGISPQELRQILERLELTLADHEPGATRGLGLHNVLFMAAELLALERDNDPCLPLVLIEEPEAHLHPQLQLRLVEFFRRESEEPANRPRLQIILTSHSPNIASKVGLAHVTLMHAGRAFSLAPTATNLDQSDYEFLERFLDVTRADLFFARGILIVEGDAEALLIPTIASILGSSLSEHGVSIINVGSVGLFRYSRIFQRADGVEIPVRVACIADRDIPPAEAKTLVGDRDTEGELDEAAQQAKSASLKSDDAGAVRTFVSDCWTLEYDLARAGLVREVHAAVSLAKASRNRRRALSPSEQWNVLLKAFREHRGWVKAGMSMSAMAVLAYEPLFKKSASKAETAQYLARLLTRVNRATSFDARAVVPKYLIDAIEYAIEHEGAAPAANAGEAVAAA